MLKKAGYSKLDSVHAADRMRKEKTAKLRNGEIQLLLTTTILERGVTFSDVQIGVFGSDGAIFTEAALVQIAGRAGRKADRPNGEVCFFHHGNTQESKRAIQHIKMMNRLGKAECLLDV
ncbi:putative late competence protein [Listeria floridensis FSL S10-1187]|uniref:Late competence protein n=1 Tax=Listeria floridensis FSL S10-1187 TaxID=1265817 RepID=A0ABN0RCS4_9LIST|nr:putative late competence protein [Listeria floridensis FSL S10-1187]